MGLALNVLAACYPSPGDPIGVAGAPPGFERRPWIQDVDRESAVLMWMVADSTRGPGRVEYRPSGGSWVTLAGRRTGRAIYSARLADLPAGSVVEYRVLPAGATAVRDSFRTAPPPGPGDQPVRALLFGDSGWGGPQQVRLASRMNEADWDLAVHLGDLAYDDGTRDELTRRHFRVYADLMARVPMWPAVGNHDLHAESGAAFDESFAWEPPFPGVRYYAYRWGRVQFVTLDTSSPTADVEGLRTGEGRQYDWLEATLRRAAADSEVTWTVVAMHHPVISHGLGISGHGPDRKLGAALVPLFEEFGVDVVAAGHEHHYERTSPVLGGRRVPPGCGPVYIVAGSAGASRYARGVGASAITEASSRAYSFVGLRLDRDAISGMAIMQDGGLLDEFQILPFTAWDEGACQE